MLIMVSRPPQRMTNLSKYKKTSIKKMGTSAAMGNNHDSIMVKEHGIPHDEGALRTKSQTNGSRPKLKVV
jgi:hypothetical protein